MSVRRYNEVFESEIEFAKSWQLWTRVSRQKYPESVRVDIYDWQCQIIHSTAKLRKVLNKLMAAGVCIFWVTEIHVPRKLKHEPEKEVLND
jgi:hypothetical protein